MNTSLLGILLCWCDVVWCHDSEIFPFHLSAIDEHKSFTDPTMLMWCCLMSRLGDLSFPSLSNRWTQVLYVSFSVDVMMVWCHNSAIFLFRSPNNRWTEVCLGSLSLLRWWCSIDLTSLEIFPFHAVSNRWIEVCLKCFSADGMVLDGHDSAIFHFHLSTMAHEQTVCWIFFSVDVMLIWILQLWEFIPFQSARSIDGHSISW